MAPRLTWSVHRKRRRRLGGACNERACRRDSVHRGLSVARLGGHPSRRPTRGVGRAALPLLALLRVGVAEPPESPRTLVRSYRTVSPLPVAAPCDAAHRRSALCCPIRQVIPSWLSPAPCPTESRPSSTPRPAFRQDRRRGHPARSLRRPLSRTQASDPHGRPRSPPERRVSQQRPRAGRTSACSRCCRARRSRASRTASSRDRRPARHPCR